MKQLRILLVVLLGTAIYGVAIADELLIGSWESNKGERIDILDGFKPNTGPVITYKNGEVNDITTWKIDPSSKELKIQYSSSKYSKSDDGGSFEWNSRTWTKSRNLETKGIANLKLDVDAFIDGLVGHSWSANSSKTGTVEFARTFSNTEGIVVRFDQEDALKALTNWGVASGTLKIGSVVYLEARITPEYLIGVDKNDGFIVLNKGDIRTEGSRTTMVDAREEFLAAMTTGAWLQAGGYSPDSVHRFRPIEGDLKGRVFKEVESKLTETSVWEFSPATGALKIGYTEYNGGMTVDKLLVFLKKDGNQVSYLRDSSIDEKRFTTADVKVIDVSERNAPKIIETVARQLSYGSQYTLFEFNEDDRTGYVHEWNSYPFQITGQTLESGNWGTYKHIYIVEDYVAFDGRKGRKIDLRQSRLRPKSDHEAQADAEKAKLQLTEMQKGRVNWRIIRMDGSEETIPLPISSLADLKSIVVIAE